MDHRRHRLDLRLFSRQDLVECHPFLYLHHSRREGYQRVDETATSAQSRKSVSIKRVILFGPECTGKTTLAEELAAHYEEPWTCEYARIYVNQVKRPLESCDALEIAKGQIEIEDASLSQARRLIIHDTNLLSTILYTRFFYSRELTPWMEAAFDKRQYDLYLLTSEEGITWEADGGQRDGPETRSQLQPLFHQMLIDRRLPHVALRGSRDQRLETAKRAIDRLISVQQKT